jgi:8-oxo-dGTP pyrophosphatase MutT (NUDIX family)
LFQLRSKTKSTHPNKLHISAAGHLSVGESIESGIREVKEELGIDVDFNSLRYLGCRRQFEDIPTPKGVFYNREFVNTYLLKDDTPLDQYILQPDELDGVYEADISDCLKLFSDEVESIKIIGKSRERERAD